ncbi:hypothetical protein PIB30_013078 [Stylosanthes scabra]|uniref:RRM domain-containing protein n=1 Tax=Stylosanthes scabra TaxID=79078 RepID=A0ABU6U549_9FABA|nr:hypothetical protein [Stylosanthes scabra]
MSTTKRELYQEFGKNGYVKDIFISRKKRRNTDGAFAFVRFCELHCLWKAIEHMSGKTWNGRKLIVKIARYACDDGIQRNVVGHQKGQSKIGTQKWVLVKHDKVAKTVDSTPMCMPVTTRRKEIHGIRAVDQTEILERSLLGVCVKPINFRMVMNRLMDECDGPGKIESRDVGPYRCLVKFSSTAIRDEAMEDVLLLSIFDEVRLLWDFTSSLSRRVWIEIFDLPINMWCGQNIMRIGELWGKVVMMDDRTEEAKSFTTARVLIDSFHWEMINEWITIKNEDREFEVFAKEVGPEVYSVESHPDRGDVVSEMVDDDVVVAMSDEPQSVSGTSPATVVGGNLNLITVEDPLNKVLINEKLNSVYHSIDEREICGDGYGMESPNLKMKENSNGESLPCFNDQRGYLGFDPALFEAHLCLQFGGKGSDKEDIQFGPKNKENFEQHGSEDSCLYPCNWMRAVNAKGDEHREETLDPVALFPASSGIDGDDAVCNDGDADSDKTRYLINREAFEESLVN